MRGQAVLITWKGKTLSQKAWARKLGLRQTTICARYLRGVRPPELFAPEPLHAHRAVRPLKFQGRTQSLRAWAQELGLPENSVNQRLRRGWSVEQALTTPMGRYQRSASR